MVGRQQPPAMQVIAERAHALGVPLHRHGVEWRLQADGTPARYVDATGRRMDLATALPGAHQAENAAIVAASIALVPELGVPEKTAARGFERVRWPGRLQRLREGRLAQMAAPSELWLDTGHNADAARVLADWGRAGPPLRLIVGLLTTKNPASFFRPFRGVARDVGTVSLGSSATAWSPAELADIAQSVGLCASPHDSLEAAVRRAGESRQRHRILIAGSFLLAGQAFNCSGVDEIAMGG